MNAWRLDVARLALLDMAAHGRRLITAEFAIGVVGCWALGVLSLRAGLAGTRPLRDWPFWLGLELIFIGFNYLPLLVAAMGIRDPLALEGARRQIREQPAEARRLGLLQAWILVPLAVVAFALFDRRRRLPIEGRAMR